MAKYDPDYTYIEAKKYIDNLPDTPENALIKYYIEFHKKWHDKDKEKIKDYQKVFDLINKFLPKTNQIYG